ncbi:MAG: tRNA (adenosine(37)-N6)-threonylcarbamoyltransferase complex ATPase subunit type 1 TsaE [Acidiferrobacterales bacterium]
MNSWEFAVADEKEMETLGQYLAPVFVDTGLVTFSGDLGAGKTTLIRGILRGLGHQESVKSPTFSLVEPYVIHDQRVYHLDLYRLSDPEEMEFIGGREYFAGNGLCLVEWPENGQGFLPPPDISVIIHKVKQGRNVRIELMSDRGAALTNALILALEKNTGEQVT